MITQVKTFMDNIFIRSGSVIAGMVNNGWMHPRKNNIISCFHKIRSHLFNECLYFYSSDNR